MSALGCFHLHVEVAMTKFWNRRWQFHASKYRISSPASPRLQLRKNVNQPTQCTALIHTLQGPTRPYADTIIDQIHKKSCAVLDGSVTSFSGSGTQLGLESTWRLSVTSGGAFREEIKTPKFTSISGYDGVSLSWSGDHTGLAQHLELDDHELTLLVTWVRSGLWASPILRHRLSIALMSKPGDEEIIFRIRLCEGKVNGTLKIDGGTLQPVGIIFDLRNDTEGMEFLDWKRWESVPLYPEKIKYESMSGTNVLNVLQIETSTRKQGNETIVSSSLLMMDYAKPKAPLLASDASFEEDLSFIPAWVTNSGHLLIKASINGEEYGYWLFDTGASGTVIDGKAAEELELETFGSFKVKGMAGDLDGRFRECARMQIGPLTIHDMLMMEMDCSGLVRGGPGRVVGIIGCDVMSRAVFDIPQVFPRPSPRRDLSLETVENTAAAVAAKSIQEKIEKSYVIPQSPSGYKEVLVGMRDPRKAPVLQDESKWMGIRWISSLPHLPVKCTSNGISQEILLMIDSGAGGMQLMLNGLTGAQLGLSVPGLRDSSKGVRTVRGVGGSGSSNIKLGTDKLESMTIGTETVRGIDCLVAAEGTQGGVELSHYTGGVLCNDILVRYRFVIDLPRDRMAIF